MRGAPMIVSRRHALGLAAGVGLSAAAAPFRRATAEDLTRATLRVAAFRGMDQTLLAATGLDDFPYRVTFSEFNSGNLIAQAINADAIDLGMWSEIPMVFAASAEARIAVVATMEGPTTDQALLAPTGSAARSVADLRGRRVGYIKATTAHYFLLRMLAQHGMSFADIHPIALGMSDGLTAMKAGSLDAWATYGYAIQTLEADGTARILQSAADILSGHYFVGANPRGLANPDFRAAAADYIRRLGKAYATLGTDKPRWARAVAPVIKVPEPLVLAYLQSQNRPYAPRAWRQGDIAGAQSVADTFVTAGVLPPGTHVGAVFSPALTPLLPA
ncbi:nitrate/sulfonate/bicarbonate transporter substrate-binding periplasmic protein [Gluconacetobacter johannae DSM 13595]|uniref:ABC transporter substrate-binding protein n=2 Tax=Gluconacetobacter johannae TaxID=112140 RepID=A0A7W4J585_9PROT|nr:ABC transporter substrate-binding protein [Gluconacetobacter johannae]GBQ87708.1 nitrate/sulfonate/bicarbonate transporter substrate-binding periplasmic protein [Gluconacetobacter johannae DSM 13595]